MGIKQLRKEWFEKMAALVKKAEEQALKDTIKEARKMEYEVESITRAFEGRLYRQGAK